VKLLAVIALVACGEPPPAKPRPPEPPPLAPWSDAWLLAQSASYLEDGAARRAGLEASLVNHDNLYSKLRLASYGHVTRGWDRLPVWNPRSLPVTAELAARLERGEMPELPPDRAPLWDGTTPTTMAAWVALGKRVFTEYPMRAEVFMEYGLTKPALAQDVGVVRTASGDVPGLVVFANIDGETRVGITCAICHSTVRDGAQVLGAARRTFDYGKLRATYDDVHGFVADPAQQRRMLSWGPGRADVTEDDDEDPVAIPDLWGLREQRHLTQAGTIRHDSPFALAIRQETQLTDSNHQRVRPPRELAWALAMYVYSLTPPVRERVASAEVTRGESVFAARCKQCHANAAYGGATVAAATIGTDPALATGRGRGTGRYRVPTLLDVKDGAPYLHHGKIASLPELLSPARAEPGHLPGTDLDDADKAALIAYLETL